VWLQTLTRSRAFRIFDRSSAILAVLCFLVLTWRAGPQYKGILSVVSAFLVVGAAATWYITRPSALADSTIRRQQLKAPPPKRPLSL
jgi:hypothetical protein